MQQTPPPQPPVAEQDALRATIMVKRPAATSDMVQPQELAQACRELPTRV